MNEIKDLCDRITRATESGAPSYVIKILERRLDEALKRHYMATLT